VKKYWGEIKFNPTPKSYFLRKEARSFLFFSQIDEKLLQMNMQQAVCK